MATELKETEYTRKVRELNDMHRQLLPFSTTVLTHGVARLPTDKLALLLATVKRFSEFAEDNDPYNEHDFGSIGMGSDTFFWKIDYYARDDFLCGSDDPSDPQKTSRVLTIMHSSEY